MVVNTTNTDMDLSRGYVSRALLQAGGKEIQTELKKNHPSRLAFGEVVKTSAGTLPIKHILHGALPPQTEEVIDF